VTRCRCFATIRRLVLVGSLLALPFTAISQVEATAEPVQSEESTVYLLRVLTVELAGFIDPNAARFVDHAIQEASNKLATLLVIQLDTPGGSSTATRQIVNAILKAPVPVAVYVAPGGARAAPAGMFVLAAAGLAAMAPGTYVGAVSPGNATGQDLPATQTATVPEDMRALVRSIAYARGRDPQPLEAAIAESRSYSATEAIDLGIADISAASLPILVRKIYGPTAERLSARRFYDHDDNRTYEIYIQSLDRSLLENFLFDLATPNLAFIPLTAGRCATHRLCQLVIQ